MGDPAVLITESLIGRQFKPGLDGNTTDHAHFSSDFGGVPAGRGGKWGERFYKTM